VKLYDCATAPSPRRVRIFAAEKNIALEKIAVDLASGEQHGVDFREVNPDCVVPVLELDDGTRISEVYAICQYLEEFQPQPALMGRTLVERATISMWNAKVEQQGMWATADAFRNAAKGLKSHALPGPYEFEQIPELAARGRKRVELFLEMLNRRLEGQEFVVADVYSIADISAMVVIDFAARIKIGLPEDAVDLERWYGQVSSRASAGA
jgi:glutathione S-transferase